MPKDFPLRSLLDNLSPHPDALAARQSEKKNWAEGFSRGLASLFADRLRPMNPKARVTPAEDGSGQEFTVGGKIDRKKTDVGVWDDAAGLVQGISIKTYTFRDFTGAKGGKPARVGRYVKNVKRNDMELRDEADVLHRRQPYAHLAAVFLQPVDAAWDGVSGQSSFAHAVFTLRKRCGRVMPESRTDLFERVFIGLFDWDGSLGFFDVAQAPPRNQLPPDDVLLSLDELVDELDKAVEYRNLGVSRDSRYAPDRSDWSPPPGRLPEGLDDLKSLKLTDLLNE